MHATATKCLGVLLVVVSVLLCLRGDGWQVGVMAPSAALAFFGLSLLLSAESSCRKPARSLNFVPPRARSKRRVRIA